MGSTKFYIDDFGKKKKSNQEEYKLHLVDGGTFFILKLKDGIYYTAQLDEYVPIKDELKGWLIREIERNDSDKFLLLNDDYDYDMIIGTMFKRLLREDKLNSIFNRLNT